MAIDETRRGRMPRLSETGRSIGGSVTALLREAIISGKLQPGDRLGQDELCAEFGVSQAPVREALRKLEADGLVEHRPNRGVFVLGLSRDELLSVVAPMRVLLETYAIDKVLSTDRDAYIRALEDLLDDMRKAAAARDLAKVNDLDVAFHDLAIQMCGQPNILQLWRSIMPRLRAEFTRLAPRHSMSDIISEHEAILAAVRSRSRRKIQAELHEHAVVGTKALLDSVPAAS